MSLELKREIRRMAKEGDLYARIVVAAESGRGVRLTADEAHRLACDSAIIDAAQEEASARLDARDST